jgi:peroxiredoxin
MNFPSNRNLYSWPILFFLWVWTLSAANLPKFLEIELKNEKAEPTALQQIKKEDQILVVCFVASSCPITHLYWGRIKGTWYNYREQGISFILVGGNSDDDMAQLKQVVKEKKIDLPLLWDPGHVLANAFGVKHTPEVVVLGFKDEIVYRGKIDDSWRDEQRVKKRFLDDALNAALEGKTISKPTDERFVGSRMR